MDRSRMKPLVFVLLGLAGVLALAGRMPKDQTVRIVLGDGAPRVTELRVRYGEEAKQGAAVEWSREATFHYEAGVAPRIVSHEPRLADGPYVVEIDVTAAEKAATITRHATLSGGTLSLDVSQAIPR